MNAPAKTWSDTRKRACVGVVFCAVTASSLMQTLLTVSLPTITTELDATARDGWVTCLYLAASTIFIPPWAFLSDRIGPRTVHVTGMIVWAVGTIGISLCGSAPLLLVSRSVQGIGAAAVVPAGFAAITAVDQSHYGRLTGLMGAVQASTILAGGPLGGWLGTMLGWRHSLQLAAVLAAPPVLLGWFVLPKTAVQRSPGSMGPNLLRSSTVRFSIAQTLLLAVIAFGVSTYLPLLLESHFHLDLTRAALLTTPTLLGVAVGSGIGGILAERKDTTGAAWGLILTGLILAWAPSVAAAALGSALAAIGVGLGLPTQLIAVEEIATVSRAAAAGGIVQGSRNIGGALGVALLGLPLQLGATSETGAHYAFSLMIIFALLTSTVTALRRRRPSRCGT